MAKKRTNPNRIPMAKREIKADELLNDTTMQNQSWRAFLLIAPGLMEQGMSLEDVRQVWDEAIAFIRTPEAETDALNRSIAEMQQTLGVEPPYRNLNTKYVTSRAALETLRRKIHRNSMHIAVCILCISLERAGRLDVEQLRKLYLNAMLTEAEIEAGATSYEAIEKEAHIRGAV